MQLNQEQIAALIPHGSTMCMLDQVVSWSNENIHCRSTDFANNANPLFENNQLETILLVEYAAQAAAIHAALLQSSLGEARAAYIGAVKNIELLKSISDNDIPIDIEAQCLLNNSAGAIYEVLARQFDDILLRGRLVLNQR